MHKKSLENMALMETVGRVNINTYDEHMKVLDYKK